MSPPNATMNAKAKVPYTKTPVHIYTNLYQTVDYPKRIPELTAILAIGRIAQKSTWRYVRCWALSTARPVNPLARDR